MVDGEGHDGPLLAGVPSRRLYGRLVRALEAEECFGGDGASEPLVGSAEDVVGESGFEPAFEILAGERQGQQAQAGALLERAPEALQSRGGIEVVRGSEALEGAEAGHCSAEPLSP